jgi:hypothetical protein
MEKIKRKVTEQDIRVSLNTLRISNDELKDQTYYDFILNILKKKYIENKIVVLQESDEENKKIEEFYTMFELYCDFFVN